MTLLTIWMLSCVLLSTAHLSTGQETGLPEYVVSECYGDIFNFDCGPGNKIRINRDFFGYSSKEGCRYRRGDCIISNPKSNSLIHRFCTGQRVCTYYMVERRGCGGYFSNYQQVEYQCIPDTSVTDICSTTEYSADSTYIASPNFPQNYPPKKNCNCVVTADDPDAKVQMEIVYLAIKYTQPCRDWLSIGRKKTCGTSLDLFQGKSIPIGFHSDGGESHSGFWLHFQSSVKGGKVMVKCGNITSTNKPSQRKKPSIDNTNQTLNEDFKHSAIEGKEAIIGTTLSPKDSLNSNTSNSSKDETLEIENDSLSDTDNKGDNGDRVEHTQELPILQGDRGQPGGIDSANSNNPQSSTLNPSLTTSGGSPDDTSRSSSQSNEENIFNQEDPEGKQGRPLSQQPSSASSSGTISNAGPIISPPPVDIDSDDSFGVQTSTVPSIKYLGGNPPKGFERNPPNTLFETERNINNSPSSPGSPRSPDETFPLIIAENDIKREEDDLEGLFDIIQVDDLNSKPQNQRSSNELRNTEKQNERLSDASGRNTLTGHTGFKDTENGLNSPRDKENELIDRELVIVETGGDDNDESETFVDITNIEILKNDNAHNGKTAFSGIDAGTNETKNATVSLPPNGPGIVETSRKEEHGIITFGLIILCICIGVGIVLIVLVLLIVYCRRRRRCTVNEETQTQGISKHTTSTSISDADGDSGQGLLTAHNANGTGIVVEVASLYTKPSHKADIGLQIDLFDDEYDDVIVFEDLSFDGSESEDNASVCGNVCFEPNDKAVQVTSPIKMLDSGGGKLRNHPIRRRPRMLEATSSVSATDIPYSENDQECHSESDMSSECVAGLCITESDLDDFSGSEGDLDSVRKESIASMSELAEVTMVPQNALVGMYDPTLEPDWDQRSGISI